MKQLPLGKKLIELAIELGVTFYESAGAPGENEAIMQARVLAALRERRDSRLWIVALVSAIASALSAFAAFYAIVFR